MLTGHTNLVNLPHRQDRKRSLPQIHMYTHIHTHARAHTEAAQHSTLDIKCNLISLACEVLKVQGGGRGMRDGETGMAESWLP